MNYSGLLNGKKNCSCGKDHSAPIKRIIVKENALDDIPEFLSDLSLSGRIHMIADKTTYSIAGLKVVDMIKSRYDVTKTVFEKENLITDMNGVDRALREMPGHVNIIIAVGSGTINDISRYVSFKSGIPYMIVATAPSMDGFASPVTPMIVEGFKISYEAMPAVAIVGDTNILAASPYNMILAGFGDIIGKYTSLADWKLGHLLSGEYYCPFIAELVSQSLEICVSAVNGLITRDKSTIESLMDALIISGLAMLFAGNSRPASGAEHNLAHFWEMYFLQKGGRQPLHGEKVGIASIIISGLYNRLKEDNIVFHPANIISDEDVISGIKRSYGRISDTVIKENFSGERLSIDPEQIGNKLNEIKKIAATVPDSSMVRSYLEKLGAYTKPEELGIDGRLKNDGIRFCMYMRKRITILRLFDALGLDLL